MKNAQFTTFTLSALPPSANNLFATGMHGRFKTIKYKRWLEASGWELRAQKPERVAGPYAMMLTFGRVNKRSDLSNVCKAVEDLAVSHNIVDDDRFAQRIVLEWGAVNGVHAMIVAAKEVGR